MVDDRMSGRPIVDISTGDTPDTPDSAASDEPLPQGEPDSGPATARANRWARVRIVVAIVAVAMVAALALRFTQGDNNATAALLPTPTPRPVVIEDARFLQRLVDEEAASSPAGIVGVKVPTNLHLFYGGDDPIRWLDLADGTMSTTGLRVEPLVQSGRHLVLASSDHRLVGWVPLDALDEMPQGWTSSRATATIEPGRTWFFHIDSSEWVDVDLASGRVLERRNAQGQTTGPVQPWHDLSLISGPDLISTPDGVYEWGAQGYERVGTGRVRATTESHALLERCDPPDAPCTVAWFDRSTWNQVNLATPTEPARSIEVAGAGRWLVASDRDNGGIELIELQTARRVRFDNRVLTVSISDDGRLVAFVRQEAIYIADLDDVSTVQRLDAFGKVGDGRLRFAVLPTDDQ